MRNKKNRSAVFVCCLSYKQPKKKPITVIGKINGKISDQVKGDFGFGYDPIFIPQNLLLHSNILNIWQQN